MTPREQAEDLWVPVIDLIADIIQQRDSANEALLAATRAMRVKDIEIDRLKYTQQKAIELAVKWEQEVEDLREKFGKRFNDKGDAICPNCGEGDGEHILICHRCGLGT